MKFRRGADLFGRGGAAHAEAGQGPASLLQLWPGAPWILLVELNPSFLPSVCVNCLWFSVALPSAAETLSTSARLGQLCIQRLVQQAFVPSGLVGTAVCKLRARSFLVSRDEPSHCSEELASHPSDDLGHTAGPCRVVYLQRKARERRARRINLARASLCHHCPTLAYVAPCRRLCV